MVLLTEEHFYRTGGFGGCMCCLDLSHCFCKKTRVGGLVLLVVFLMWTPQAVRQGSGIECVYRAWSGEWIHPSLHGVTRVRKGHAKACRTVTCVSSSHGWVRRSWVERNLLSGEWLGAGCDGVPGSLAGSCRVT